MELHLPLELLHANLLKLSAYVGKEGAEMLSHIIYKSFSTAAISAVKIDAFLVIILSAFRVNQVQKQPVIESVKSSNLVFSGLFTLC